MSGNRRVTIGEGELKQLTLAAGVAGHQLKTLAPATYNEQVAPKPDVLQFPSDSREFLWPYLPPADIQVSEGGLPFVTLTYATSMDSMLAIAPGRQTQLSGPQSKAMTHYLRSKHDAILVGVGTALADDPGLNCRLDGAGGHGGYDLEGQPVPIIIDPRGRWQVTPDSRIIKAVSQGRGRAPWVMTLPGIPMDRVTLDTLNHYRGRFLCLPSIHDTDRLEWRHILQALASEGIKSVMIEGGGTVINELLQAEHGHLIGSAVVTVAPTYLGAGGVAVCPARNMDETLQPMPVTRFTEVQWHPLGEDVVMCGRVDKDNEIPKYRAPMNGAEAQPLLLQ
ncbi:2,5-diamino-6-(ribosylamino)-4(3H)-pyrimidinone 5'-phosphate reductase [Bachmanniomyces sp. S44760]|nr:2,5-diamino-6-(ribosylamino)-4(3H)-pyrimidinone 5'-phosphate reductase [Bachmanniomyces sp. S44760]